MKTLYFALIMMLVGISCFIIPVTPIYATCAANLGCDNGDPAQSGASQIIISRDTFSPTSQVNILIRTPDFNSNPYAIDTIGEDGSKVIISTRESRIPYRLVETGPDTGDFAGYVMLSSTTSTCSPVCGPTDGFLAAGGNDAITVSLIYPDGNTISSTSFSSTPTNHNTIPEFPYAELVLITSVVSLIFFSKMNV